MTSIKDLVDEEYREFLHYVPNYQFTDEGVKELRKAFPINPFNVEGVKCEELRIPGPQGAPDVRIFHYYPSSHDSSKPVPALLWMHPGGHILGDPSMDHARLGTIVKELGMVVINVDYRLSPEVKFPSGIEDCYAALKWIHTNAGTLFFLSLFFFFLSLPLFFFFFLLLLLSYLILNSSQVGSGCD